jgi:hypothetical protein
MQKLIITLDEKTTDKYLKMMRKKTELDLLGECMPSGGTVCIEIVPVFGAIVYLDNVSIGEAEVDLIEI